jgi:uncharacterized protein YggT (Ycf19 family)
MVQPLKNWLKSLLSWQIFYALAGLLAGLLLVRFILKLLAVSDNLLYRVTNPIVSPFKTLIKPNDSVIGASFELYTLAAVLFLAACGVALSGLLAWLEAKSSKPNF